MKNYISEWENAATALTCESDRAVVHVCTNDLMQGESAEQKREAVSQLAHDILYRQALRKEKKRQSRLREE